MRLRMTEDSKARLAGLDLIAVGLASTVNRWLVRTEPLDGDETELLTELFRVRLDWWQGNLTEPEAKAQLRAVLKEQLQA